MALAAKENVPAVDKTERPPPAVPQGGAPVCSATVRGGLHHAFSPNLDWFAPMLCPPVPDDEAARLLALHANGLLNSPPDPAFDDLIELVRSVFKVSAVIISLRSAMTLS